jgi:aryl-alcohol dehydrogenase-like predicted oxidoreductase
VNDTCFLTRRTVSRREILALGAGIVAAAALPYTLALAAASPVLTRPIPRTGERLPVVGLGTAIVLDIGDDAAKRVERRAVIQTMIEGGGRLIDTAPSYGTAESVLGDLLTTAGTRDRIFLATKVRVTGRDASVAEMQQSLKRLHSGKLDLMQLHNARDPKTDLRLLKEWQEKGIVRYIGITNSDTSAYGALGEIIRREKPEFLQVSYSLSERSVEERLLPLAADTGTAVLTALPFGRGRLFNAVRGKQLPEWAAEFDAKTWGQFFLKYLLAHPAVNCVIPGTDKPEYMADNLEAGRGRLPDAAMQKKMVDFWNSLA